MAIGSTPVPTSREPIGMIFIKIKNFKQYC